MIQAAAAFADAAREAKLEAIVGLSQWLANPAHPSLATRQHWLADRLFAALPGIALTVVAPGFFADMPYLSPIRYVAQLGIFPMPAHGASRDAPPSVDDIARVAVAALIDPAKHAGHRYRPTGPDMLSLHDMARVMGRVFGRTVRHLDMPAWMFRRAARMDGFDSFLLSQMGHFMRDLDRGAFAFGGPDRRCGGSHRPAAGKLRDHRRPHRRTARDEAVARQRRPDLGSFCERADAPGGQPGWLRSRLVDARASQSPAQRRLADLASGAWCGAARARHAAAGRRDRSGARGALAAAHLNCLLWLCSLLPREWDVVMTDTTNIARARLPGHWRGFERKLHRRRQRSGAALRHGGAGRLSDRRRAAPAVR